MLSSRLPKDLSPSPFFAELERAKAESAPFIDMTVSSPVKAGLPIDLDAAVESARSGFGCWNPDAAGWKRLEAASVAGIRMQQAGSLHARRWRSITASAAESLLRVKLS